jgi:circadian clock protein KaiC
MTHAPRRLPSGIPGLDRLMEGGFLEGGVYLIEGPPGAGKTIFGNQICFHHAAEGRSALYITLLAESHSRMLLHLGRMHFFDASAIPDRIRYLNAYSLLQTDSLAGVARMARQEIERRGASVLVLDGLVVAELSAPSDEVFKMFVHDLQALGQMFGCTILLLSNLRAPSPNLDRAHTMVDGIVELSDEITRLKSFRHLEIRKMRGTEQSRGRHTFAISDDGIFVWPRFESSVSGKSDEATGGRRRLAFEIPALDAMLRGGLPRGSTTMLLGPTGTGKTTLAVQYLRSGVDCGERGLYFGFYERPEALRGAVEAGAVEIMWQPPVEGIIDVLAGQLLDAVRRFSVRRLVVDGFRGFMKAADHPERLEEVYSSLINELESEGVTTIYTHESPTEGLSSLAHNLILLRHVELQSQLYRFISISKVRNSDHDGSVREFWITDRGVDVEAKSEDTP